MSGGHKGEEGLDDLLREGCAVRFGEELVAGGVDGEELMARGDSGEGGADFFDRAEGIAGAVDEERWRVELRKVPGAELIGFARRMERVGEEEKRVGQGGTGRGRFCGGGCFRGGIF